MSFLDFFNLKQFIILCNSQLPFLKNMSHLFCRMSLKLGLSDVSSCLDSGSTLWAEETTEVTLCSLHNMKRYILSRVHVFTKGGQCGFSAVQLELLWHHYFLENRAGKRMGCVHP